MFLLAIVISYVALCFNNSLFFIMDIDIYINVALLYLKQNKIHITSCIPSSC